ncbi:MAG: 50S ribosomal protein L21 [Bacteroidota bacterium]|nr:50S ribosomal protein L21 [Bacteroidota bacterium]MDE2833239.1 50S ribosomal protein L21 [Bacteroidota bacterium]MDE2955853.1 50S ribosomal protein L21 [Bacteroidota bacterium]
MYAIVEISGKQYKVSPEDQIYIPYQPDAAVGDSIVLPNVLLWADGDNIQVGCPCVPGAEAKANVLGHVSGDKVIVFKKKRRKRYKVKRGHRQLHTRIQISQLTLN